MRRSVCSTASTKIASKIGLSSHERLSARAAVREAESQLYCRVVLEQILRATAGEPYDMNQAHQAHRLFASVLHRAWPTVCFDIIQHRSAIAWTGGPTLGEVREVLGALACSGKTAVVYLDALGGVGDQPAAWGPDSVAVRAKTLPRLFRWDEVPVVARPVSVGEAA